MLPDIALRLKSIVKTLRDIVLPAVPESEQNARDQVMLIIDQLAIIEPQWKAALKFELGSHDLLRELARTLLPLADDEDLRSDLGAAVDASATLDRTDYDAVSREVKRLGCLLDRVISGDFTTTPMDSRLFDAVLDYGAREAWRNRVWFAASGVDPDVANLPGIETVLRYEES
jgi:hypothetical protein